MGRRIAYIWRLARTWFAFAVFGALAPAVALIALPVASWRASDRLDRERRVQRGAHRASRAFLWLLDRLGLTRFEIRNAERLRAPGSKLVVANHPTLIDVLVLLAQMPQADLIVSGDRARNVFLKTLVGACGYESNETGAAVVEACANRIRAGRSLVVFPEGTRSPLGGLHRFQRGAAHIALASKCDLVPVAICCDPPALGKAHNWYHVPDRAFTVTATVGESIPIESIAPTQTTPLPAPLAARRLTARVRAELSDQIAKSASSRLA